MPELVAFFDNSLLLMDLNGALPNGIFVNGPSLIELLCELLLDSLELLLRFFEENFLYCLDFFSSFILSLLNDECLNYILAYYSKNCVII